MITNVWAVCPSAASISQASICFQAWRDMGYKVAAATEYPNDRLKPYIDSLVFQKTYPGYAQSINGLAEHVLYGDPDCDVIVAMADDIWPDLSRPAPIIAEEFKAHFKGWLGVMQPTGDRWTLANGDVPQIDKAAMSPWLGREWCRRAYQGTGPLWPEYHHNFVDNDLQEVAKKLGLFHQRQDITHMHQHWLRIGNQMPAHARHQTASWDADKALFAQRYAAGFPESELLP